MLNERIKLKGGKMKRALLLVWCFMLISVVCIAEDMKEAGTKMDQFVSKTGTMVKYVDYNLPDLKLKYGVAETRIRKIMSGGEIGHFYQISKEGQYDTKTASIAYEDLIEVLKAFKTLKEEVSNDVALNPDYLENRFITEDGFQLGYFVNKGKANWVLILERYGSGNTVFVKDLLSIEQALNNAKNRIEELK